MTIDCIIIGNTYAIKDRLSLYIIIDTDIRADLIDAKQKIAYAENPDFHLRFGSLSAR